MAYPLLDQSDTLSVDNTEYNDTKMYRLTATRDYYLIREITIAWGSTFKTAGRYQAQIKGRPFTKQGSVTADFAAFKDGITLPFDDVPLLLEPGEDIQVRFKISSGSDDVFVQVVGLRLTPEEAKDYIARHGLRM